jgi:hypothetical protein
MRIRVSSPVTQKAKDRSGPHALLRRTVAAGGAKHEEIARVTCSRLYHWFGVGLRQTMSGKLAATGREIMNLNRILFSFTLAAVAGALT